MACFFVPSGIQPLKEKLNVFATADIVLAWIPFFALIVFLCVKLVFPDEVGPIKALCFLAFCLVCVCHWYLELFLAYYLRFLLKKFHDLSFYVYYLVKMYLQYLLICWIFALRRNNLSTGYTVSKDTMWPVPYYFLVGLITFYAALIPYRIYELVLVIYFHYLSKKNPNPQELVVVVVEINVPPPPSQKS